MAEIVLLVLQIVIGFALLPITLILGGRNGVFISVFAVLIDGSLAAADFAGGNTLTNALLCSNCSSTALYPYVFVPIVIAAIQFVIVLTKRF